MNVSHHLDDATLLRYAGGDLDEAFLVLAASHLAMCGACRKAARQVEAVGGHLLEDAGEADLAPGAFERLKARLEAGGAPVPAPRAALEPSEVPLPLRRFIGDSLDNVPWKTVVPGLRRHPIRLAPETRSSLYMLHIGPGRRMPEHGHGGAEMTLILRGAYTDMMGRFGPGDVADLDEHVEHQPKVEGDAPCICLVATEAPTRFKSLVGRLLQPLVGI